VQQLGQLIVCLSNKPPSRNLSLVSYCQESARVVAIHETKDDELFRGGVPSQRIGFVHGRRVGVRCRTTARSVKGSWKISSTGLGAVFKLHVEASQQWCQS